MFTDSRHKSICFALFRGIAICIIFISSTLFINNTLHSVQGPRFVQSTDIPLKEKQVQKQVVTYLLPESFQLNKSSQTFEQQVISEVRRVCSEIYPDLDSDYVTAIIWLESRFEPDAVNSKTGAVGLMQILPKWHISRAENLGVSLDDWRGNILTGCDILNEIFQLKGSMSYAINFYAGGYVYADYYKATGKQSPYELLLDGIISSGTLQILEGR